MHNEVNLEYPNQKMFYDSDMRHGSEFDCY